MNASSLFVPLFQMWLLASLGEEPGGALGEWRSDLSVFVGGFFAPVEIGRDINATGGEQLIARLGDGVALGIHLAFRNDLFGVGLGIVTRPDQIDVENEFGVGFPNHAKPPVLIVGDLSICPFRGAFLGGRVEPYLTAGVGGGLFSVDLDNVNGETSYNLWLWSAGGGVRYYLAGQKRFFEFKLTRSQLAGRGPIDSFAVNTLVLGVGTEL